MIDEEYAKLLSDISGVKETILDNFDNRFNLDNIPKLDIDRYNTFYNDALEKEKLLASLGLDFTEPSALFSLQKSLKEQAEQSTVLSEFEKASMSLSDILSPTLTDELSKLNSLYSEKDMWQNELDKINSSYLTAIGRDSALSSFSGLHSGSSNTAIASRQEQNEEVQEDMSNIKINSIQLSNFRFFIDDEKNNTFEPNGQNMLVYGENGSGKSSLFKAFEFLAKTEIPKDEFKDNKNIFNKDKDTFLEFKFDNEKEIKIHEGNLELNDDYPYIKALSIFKPVLDYKHLLKVHYQTDKKKDEINIYEMLKELFKDYPYDGIKKLSSISNPKDYFEKLEETINENFLDDINKYLEIFDDRFKIEKFHFDMSFLDDGKGVEFIVNIKIDFKNIDNLLSKYHLFLNEARLTALAISIYFAIIKNISDKLDDNSLKLLVLDDLLISLDMSNRLNLIDLLKDNFEDFQIFFFTHDKGLFEIFKDKMEWKAYEIYVNDITFEYEIPLLVKKKSYLTRARDEFKNIHHDSNPNLDCISTLLRKYSEQILFNYLPKEQRLSSTCEKLQLNDLLQNAIRHSSEQEEVTILLKKLNTFRQTIFNPQAHDNDMNLFKREIKDAIEILEILKEKI